MESVISESTVYYLSGLLAKHISFPDARVITNFYSEQLTGGKLTKYVDYL